MDQNLKQGSNGNEDEEVDGDVLGGIQQLQLK